MDENVKCKQTLKCLNVEFFLVCIFPFSVQIRENTDQKKILIWIIFIQCNPFIELFYREVYFPRQYHTLNAVFRLLHIYTKISNIFYKINFRYLPNSAGSRSYRFYKKTVLNFFLKKTQTYNLHNYLKKTPVQVFFCEFYQILFQKLVFVKHFLATASAKYPFIR